MLASYSRPLRFHHRLTRQFSRTLTTNPLLDIHPEVRDALAAKKPVVALESTVITHGMPFPTNLELGQSLERIVRSTGAVPATIGVIGGRVKIGMERKQMEELADTKANPSTVKISRRDIAPVLAKRMNGGTTCSSTLIFAALAGIKVFATGGLGGVHRGGETSMDISADLFELSRCPVGLVSAGIKSILDIPRTLEYLETLGVPVVSYGNSTEFPAFFTRKSGIHVPWNVESPLEAANLLHAQRTLGLENGALIAVPVPEKHEPDGALIQAAIEQAIRESEENGISKRGKEVTPWLLNRIIALTDGRSLTSNVALLENTALIGSQIAIEYAKLENGPENYDRTLSIPTPLISTRPSSPQHTSHDAVVVGSAAIDITAQSTQNSAHGAHSTTPGAVTMTLGGVARNVAEASHRIQSQGSQGSTLLVAPIGNDYFGTMMVEATNDIGMSTAGLVTQANSRTAVCNLMLDNRGDLTCGVADMSITEELSSSDVIEKLTKYSPRFVLLDGNLAVPVIQSVVEFCCDNEIKTLFEPTSVFKSTNILPAISSAITAVDRNTSPIDFAFPNHLELSQIYQTAQDELMQTSHWWKAVEGFSLGSQYRMELDMLSRQAISATGDTSETLKFLTTEGIAQMAIHILPFFQHLFIKLGSRGALFVGRMSTSSAWKKESSDLSRRTIVAHGESGEVVVLRHFPPLSDFTLVNSTGAGDSFAGSILASLTTQSGSLDSPASLERTVNLAQQAAVMTLQSQTAVSPTIGQIIRQ